MINPSDKLKSGGSILYSVLKPQQVEGGGSAGKKETYFVAWAYKKECGAYTLAFLVAGLPKL